MLNLVATLFRNICSKFFLCFCLTVDSFLSTAALGILYLHGLGVNKDTKSSFQCLKNAAERGNIYAIGQLSFFYYKMKLYNNAVDFAQRFVVYEFFYIFKS